MTWFARARHGWPLVVLLVVVMPVAVLAACSGAVGAGGPPQGAVVVVDNGGASPAVTYPRSTGRAIDGAMTEAEIAKVDPVADVGRWPGEPVPPAPRIPSRPRLAAPVIPAEAREPTVEGMKKALMFYLNNVRSHMYLTGQTKYFREICQSDGEYCAQFLEDADRTHRNRTYGYFATTDCGGFHVVRDFDEQLRFYLEAECVVGPGRDYRYSGEFVEEFPGGKYTLVAMMEHRQGTWALTRYLLENMKPDS